MIIKWFCKCLSEKLPRITFSKEKEEEGKERKSVKSSWENKNIMNSVLLFTNLLFTYIYYYIMRLYCKDIRFLYYISP